MIESKQIARWTTFQKASWIGVGLLVGVLVGSTMNTSLQVRADVTELPRREAFKDGGVLNEAVLREISATLKRMETRLEQIQKNTDHGTSQKAVERAPAVIRKQP